MMLQRWRGGWSGVRPGSEGRRAGRRRVRGCKPECQALEARALMAVAGDFNGDGIHDLAVGAPGEDVGSLVDAGAVSVFFGRAPVFNLTVGNQFLTQDSPGVEEASEAGD